MARHVSENSIFLFSRRSESDARHKSSIASIVFLQFLSNSERVSTARQGQVNALARKRTFSTARIFVLTCEQGQHSRRESFKAFK